MANCKIICFSVLTLTEKGKYEASEVIGGGSGDGGGGGRRRKVWWVGGGAKRGGSEEWRRSGGRGRGKQVDLGVGP